MRPLLVRQLASNRSHGDRPDQWKLFHLFNIVSNMGTELGYLNDTNFPRHHLSTFVVAKGSENNTWHLCTQHLIIHHWIWGQINCIYSKWHDEWSLNFTTLNSHVPEEQIIFYSQTCNNHHWILLTQKFVSKCCTRSADWHPDLVCSNLPQLLALNFTKNSENRPNFRREQARAEAPKIVGQKQPNKPLRWLFLTSHQNGEFH